MKENRYLYIDLAKVIAIFLVIVNHTNSGIFLSLSPSPIWFLSVFYFYVSKIAVPIFIMCTGALLVSRVDGYGKHLQRLWRAIAVLFVASFIYFHAGSGFNISNETVKSFFIYFINKPTSNALWYMYLYIGIISVMPFLQRLAACLTKRDTEILICISLIVPGCISLIGHFINVTLYERANFFIYSYPIGYLFVGNYISNYAMRLRPYTKLAIFIFIAFTILATFLTYFQYKSGYSVSLYWSYLSSLTVVIPSVSIFYSVIIIASKLKKQLESSIVQSISMCSFGMYIFSDMIIISTTKFYSWLSSVAKPFLSCLIWQLIIFTIALITSYLVRKIPCIRKYL